MARVSPYTGRENRWNLAWPTDHHRPAIPLNGASKSRSSRWDPPIQAARQRGSTSINPQGKYFSPALSGFPSELFKHNDRLYVYIHRGETLSLSLSLSPLEFDDLLEKNIGGKKKGGRRGLTPIRRRTMGENRIAQRVWKRPIPWQMKARYEHTYIYIPCARDVVAIFSPTSSESLRLLQFFRAISIREPQEFAISKEKKRKETDSSILYSRLFRDNLRGRATDNHSRSTIN